MSDTPPFNVFSQRLKRVCEQMEPNSLMVLCSHEVAYRNNDVAYPYRANSDILYLTGINREDFNLVILDSGEVFFYTPKPDKEKERWVGSMPTSLEISKSLGFSKASAMHKEQFPDHLAKLLANKKIIYYNFFIQSREHFQIMSLLEKAFSTARKGNLPPLKCIHTSTILHEMRLIKDKLEVENIKKASHISAAAHNALMQYTRESKVLSEKKMRSFIEQQFRRRGCDELAYPSIVAAGNNATILHYPFASGMAAENDLILVDAGCEWNFYASDITRTFPVYGKFSSVQKELYTLVLLAQTEAIKKALPENAFLEIHETAVKVLVQGLWDLGLLKKIYFPNDANGINELIRPTNIQEVIEKEYYKVFYMHSTSHFLGLDVHDAGFYFIDNESRPLLPGMVLTVEPALYFPQDYDWLPSEFQGIGIRIEDNIHICAHAPENLTQLAVKTIGEIEESL